VRDRREERNLDGKRLALAIADAALEKQAHAVEIVDVADKVDYTSFVVICSGRSERQVDAIAEAVETELKRLDVHALGVEGREGKQWVLMDFGDVVFHVFEETTRGFYDLDGLWIDAERVPLRRAASR
jgi:ribosome-associated protein